MGWLATKRRCRGCQRANTGAFTDQNLEKAQYKSNPLDDEALSTLIGRLDGVLVTHLHRDHFDSRAAELLPKTLPIFCQPVDADRLAQPLHWRKPRRVFVCSLADLFHDDVQTARFGLRDVTTRRCAQAAKDTAALIEESITRSNDGKTKVDQVADAIRATNITDNVSIGGGIAGGVGIQCQLFLLSGQPAPRALAQPGDRAGSSAATSSGSAGGSSCANGPPSSRRADSPAS